MIRLIHMKTRLLLLSAALLAWLCLLPAAASAQSHTVTLNWAWSQGTGGTASSFQVQRGTISGGPYATIGTVPGITTQTYADSGALGSPLVEGQKYCYVVQAVGTGGTSSSSPEACGTIPFSVPNAPASLTLTIK